MRVPWHRKRRQTATNEALAGSESAASSAAQSTLAALEERNVSELGTEQRSALKLAIDGPLAKIHVPAAVLETTGQFLSECGAECYEGVVLWVGVVDLENQGRVVSELIPRQLGYRTPEGVAVQIPDEEIRRILFDLPVGMVILCRVHSHPGTAYHSSTDDLNQLLAHAGAISIVVPDFARAPIDLRHCSVNELDEEHRWRELARNEVMLRFVVDD